jgi:hypothetical protein
MTSGAQLSLSNLDELPYGIGLVANRFKGSLVRKADGTGEASQDRDYSEVGIVENGSLRRHGLPHIRGHQIPS